MKTRQSGMPAEETWQSFFEPTAILLKLGLTADCERVVDLGCGYGTFALPAARMIRGVVHALDIDELMIEHTRALAPQNLVVTQCDFVDKGTGLPDGFADFVLLFNLLHASESALLLEEAKRILSKSGKLAIMHWNYDPSTPRGPSMEIRLRPEQCIEMVQQVGLVPGKLIDLPPYHFGFVATHT